MKSLHLKLKEEILLIDPTFSNAIYLKDLHSIIDGVLIQIPDDYKFIGKFPEITVKQAEELVKSEEKIFKTYYISYTGGLTYGSDALKSLQTVMEFKSFNSENTFVFKKNK